MLPLQAHALQLGDLDGDGLADLSTLGNPSSNWESELRVLFFDKPGTATKTYDSHTPFSSPMVSQLFAGDNAQLTRPQIIAGTKFGIATLAADPAKEMSAVPYAFQTVPTGSSYRMVRIRGVAGVALGEEVLLYLSNYGQSQLAAAGSNKVVGKVDRPVEDLSGDPIAGNIADAKNSPCDELILTFHGDNNLYAHGLCDTLGNWQPSSQTPAPVASIPAGHSIEKGATLAWVNDDSHLDVIVGDERGCPYLAFGQGDGSFVADPQNPVLTLGQLWPIATASSSCPDSAALDAEDYPLAIGDLNHDGISDWVFPKGISLFRGVTPNVTNQRIQLDAYPSNGPFVKKWSVARIADLNRDGLMDLIAGSSLVSDLDFLVGTGQDRLNRTSILTDGPVRRIVTGDYDGDLTNDIAFVQEHALVVTAPGTPANSLAIAFGVPMGAPNTPILVAPFGAVEQLISANYQTDDAIEEIAVLAQAADNSAKQLTLFVGNAGRHPISSLGLWNAADDGQPPADSSFASTAPSTPIASSVGRFPSGDGTAVLPGVLALARDACSTDPCLHRLWFVPGSASGGLDTPIYSGGDPPLPTEALLYRESTGELSAYVVVGRLNKSDPAGPDEALLLTAGPDESHVSLWRVALPFPANNPLTLLGEPVPGVLTSTSSPTLVDLDGDGWRDLVMLLADDTRKLQLKVAWNDNGTLAPTKTLDVPDQILRGLAVRNTADSQSLFVTTDRGIYTFAAVEHGDLGDPTLVQYHDDDGGGDLPGGNAIAIGDMTGDGLPDLAVAVAGGLRIYQEHSTRP